MKKLCLIPIVKKRYGRVTEENIVSLKKQEEVWQIQAVQMESEKLDVAGTKHNRMNSVRKGYGKSRRVEKHKFSEWKTSLIAMSSVISQKMQAFLLNKSIVTKLISLGILLFKRIFG